MPEEGAELWKLNVEIFGDDAFEEDLWLRLESYWIVVDGRVAGCAAFIRDVEFQEDLRGDGEKRGSTGYGLYSEYGAIAGVSGARVGKTDQGVGD